MMSSSSARLHIPADHPALAGHFPGNPVVPATFILDAVRDSITPLLSGRRLGRLNSAKFLSPLHPGEEATIEINERDDVVRFRCLRGADILAQGEIILIAED